MIFKSQRINEVGFLIEVPTSFSSIEKLAKKWQMAHTERHPPKEIGRARPFFKILFSVIWNILYFPMRAFQKPDIFFKSVCTF